MLFTERYRSARARILGLVWLCMGSIGAIASSACEDEEDPAPAHSDDDESSSSSSSGSSSGSARRSSASSSSSSTRSTSTKSKSVASCKSGCDDKGDDCKLSCDEDDEDCNQACDDDRYTCRKKCEKTSSTSSSSSSSDDDADEDSADKRDAGTSTRRSSSDAGTSSDASMSVTIKFAARVGSEDFACGQEYTNIGKTKTTVTPTDLRMFVQDLKLISQGGDEVPVELDTRTPWQSTDVALLDFEDGSGDCAEGNAQLNTKITGKVRQDTYVGIIFSNGVPEALNHEDPTTADDPLSTFTDLSWGWLGGYIFTKVELRQVTTGSSFGSGIAHVGSTACSGKPQSGTVKCTKPNRNLVQLDEFNPKTDTIVFDVAPIFEQTDLTQMSDCHSTGEFCAPMFEALGVDLTTGKALSKQSVFSVK